MAIPLKDKRKAMEAISHPEVQAHALALRGAGLAKSGSTAAKPAVRQSPGLTFHQAKQMAMNAIKHVETVAQIGWGRLAGGAAVYAAHIRQVDRQAQRDAPRENYPRSFSDARHTYGRE